MWMCCAVVTNDDSIDALESEDGGSTPASSTKTSKKSKSKKAIAPLKIKLSKKKKKKTSSVRTVKSL